MVNNFNKNKILLFVIFCELTIIACILFRRTSKYFERNYQNCRNEIYTILVVSEIWKLSRSANTTLYNLYYSKLVKFLT